jgi:hypothetical protein
MPVLELTWRDKDGNLHLVRSDPSRYLVTFGKGSKALSVAISELVGARVLDDEDSPKGRQHERLRAPTSSSSTTTERTSRPRPGSYRRSLPFLVTPERLDCNTDRCCTQAARAASTTNCELLTTYRRASLRGS